MSPNDQAPASEPLPEVLGRVELRHLVALRAVAAERSFGKAAGRLGYTQSAVSQQIAALERAVGERLFERPGGPKPVTLTRAGELLLGHAEGILDRVAAAEADLAGYRAGRAGHLTIGTFQSVSVEVLPVLLPRLRSVSPDLTVAMSEEDEQDELLRRLGIGELDLTFVVAPVAAFFLVFLPASAAGAASVGASAAAGAALVAVFLRLRFFLPVFFFVAFFLALFFFVAFFLALFFLALFFLATFFLATFLVAFFLVAFFFVAFFLVAFLAAFFFVAFFFAAFLAIGVLLGVTCGTADEDESVRHPHAHTRLRLYRNHAALCLSKHRRSCATTRQHVPATIQTQRHFASDGASIVRHAAPRSTARHTARALSRHAPRRARRDPRARLRERRRARAGLPGLRGARGVGAGAGGARGGRGRRESGRNGRR